MEATAPAFSVVIPTRRRPRQLGACLAALAQLEYPRDRVEVIVVIDGADPLAERAVTEADLNLDLKLARQQPAGAAAARNTGVARAEGDFVAFIDDDCIATPTWLGAIGARVGREADAAIGGQTLNGMPENLYSTASQVVIDAAHAHWNRGGSRPRFFASNNLALPVAGFREIGGFDRSFAAVGGEDRDLCDRWVRSGRPMAYAPGAVVHHRKELTLGGFMRQHYRYGKGARRFHRARTLRGSRRSLPEPGFYAELARQGHARAHGIRRMPMAALLTASQVANVAGYLSERSR